MGQSKAILFLKKRIVIIIAVVFFITGSIIFYFLNYFPKLDPEEICRFRGGKMFYHSFREGVCEVESRDAGNSCKYDNECALKCIYKGPPDYSYRKNNFLFPEEYAKNGGKCDGFFNDDDGVEQCHRLQGEKVQCDWWAM